MEDVDGNGAEGAQERHHKKPERTLSWDTNYDKEGSFNHIPLLTTGRSVSCSSSLLYFIQFCFCLLDLELNWVVFWCSLCSRFLENCLLHLPSGSPWHRLKVGVEVSSYV